MALRANVSGTLWNRPLGLNLNRSSLNLWVLSPLVKVVLSKSIRSTQVEANESNLNGIDLLQISIDTDDTRVVIKQSMTTQATSWCARFLPQTFKQWKTFLYKRMPGLTQTSSLYTVILRARVVLKRTVVGDWLQPGRKSSYLQIQVNSVCQAMVFQVWSV